MSTERARRDEAAKRAYMLQVIEGSKAAVKMGTLGLGVITLAHYTWPTFRTPPLTHLTLPTGVKPSHSKHFSLPYVSVDKEKRALTLVNTIVATSGLVIGADNALLSHEAELRQSEQAIRRLAVIELSRQGRVPTETAIARWRDERARQEATLVKTRA